MNQPWVTQTRVPFSPPLCIGSPFLQPFWCNTLSHEFTGWYSKWTGSDGVIFFFYLFIYLFISPWTIINSVCLKGKVATLTSRNVKENLCSLCRFQFLTTFNKIYHHLHCCFTSRLHLFSYFTIDMIDELHICSSCTIRGSHFAPPGMFLC